MPNLSLLSLFPKPDDVLAFTPEDLGGVIIELMPPLLQNGLTLNVTGGCLSHASAVAEAL
jgi:hypothetical protein